jgi:four helix bundle protein
MRFGPLTLNPLPSGERVGRGGFRRNVTIISAFAIMAKFRFQDLKIWQMAIEIAHELFDITDNLDRKKLFRFAEQLRGAGMSMSNNIAEGSGSTSKKGFMQFLNVARRSTFEKANILILLRFAPPQPC